MEQGGEWKGLTSGSGLPKVRHRVTRLGDFLPFGLLLEAHYDFLKG
jgi:hypothetical protein